MKNRYVLAALYLTLTAAGLLIAQNKVDLANQVSGTLPAGNGGTGVTTFSFNGNTTKVHTATGTYTSGHGVVSDANGNLADSGAAPSAGTVTSIATTGPITGGPITNTGTIGCPTCLTAAVTSIATTAPIVGGTITGTGTVSCPTCVTGPAVNGVGQIVAGWYNSASQTFLAFSEKTGTTSFIDGLLPIGGYLRNISLNLGTTESQSQGFVTTLSARNANATVSVIGQGPVLIGGSVLGSYISPVQPIRLETGARVNFTPNVLGTGGGTIQTIAAEYVGDSNAIPILGAMTSNGIIAQTSFGRFFDGTTGAINSQTVEGASLLVMPFDATFSNFMATLVSANGATANAVWTLRVNGSDTSLTFTMGNSATVGTYSDQTAAHNASITAGQTFCFKVVESNVTSGNTNGFSVAATPTSGTKTIVAAIADNGGAAIGNGVTLFSTPFVNSTSTTEANQRMVMPRSGTAKNLYAYVKTASAAANTLVITLRSCTPSGGTCTSSSTALTGTVSAATSGVITLDTAHSVSLNAGDMIDVSLAQTGASGAVLTSWSFELD